MNSIVLAGGKGGRLGRDKTVERIGGKTMLQRVVDSLSSISDEIIIVIAPGQAEPILSTEVRVAVDLYPGKGALGGIYTGLAASTSFHNLVVACDMPFLNLELIHYLINTSHDFDAVVPRDGKGRLEPLHAMYSRDCMASIYRQIQHGDLKIDGFLGQVKVRYVEETEVDIFDPDHLSFFNINNAGDLKKARALLDELDFA